MKIKNIFILSFLLGFFMQNIVFANHILVGSEVERVISYNEEGNKIITLIFDPAKTPDFIKDDVAVNIDSVKDTETKTVVNNQPENKKLLTQAPKVGITLGHIIDENAAPNITGLNRFTEAYQSGTVGQCTWYAKGRFKEIYGVELPYWGSAKKWADSAESCLDVIVIRDLSDIPEQCIAVYEPKDKYSDLPGHVCFIEYIERDKNGNPINIYYTDANGKHDPQKGEYTAGWDGAVIKESFKIFKGDDNSSLKLTGYIVPAK